MLRAGGRLLGATTRLHSLAWLQTLPGFAPGSFYNVVVFMAAQSSEDGRDEVLPKTLMRVGIPKKGSSKTIPHSISGQFSEGRELMVNNQHYDSHVGRPSTVARVFHS